MFIFIFIFFLSPMYHEQAPITAMKVFYFISYIVLEILN
jgi:hypothetical protein